MSTVSPKRNGSVPRDDRLLDHHVERAVVADEGHRPGHRRLDPGAEGVVAVGEVVGVEHDALHVAFAVADAQRVAVRHRTGTTQDPGRLVSIRGDRQLAREGLPCASSSARNASSWTPSACGPPPPGDVRRATATPGATRRRPPGPSAGSAATSSPSGVASSRWRRTRFADDGVGIAERRAAGDEPLGEVGRRGRLGVGGGLPSARVERRRRDHPGERAERRATPGRPSRTAAPCPPAGRGCRRAAGP